MTSTTPELGWLQTDWRAPLRTAAARALHREIAAGQEVAVLARLDGRQLLQVEAELRRSGDARALSVVSATTPDGVAAGDEALVGACLFTMAAHRSGFI